MRQYEKIFFLINRPYKDFKDINLDCFEKSQRCCFLLPFQSNLIIKRIYKVYHKPCLFHFFHSRFYLMIIDIDICTDMIFKVQNSTTVNFDLTKSRKFFFFSKPKLSISITEQCQEDREENKLKRS